MVPKKMLKGKEKRGFEFTHNVPPWMGKAFKIDKGSVSRAPIFFGKPNIPEGKLGNKFGGAYF
jgi:hypothetical protein